MVAQGIQAMMQAAQVVEFNQPYKIQEIETPSGLLRTNDMLIKIAAASLCHTDDMVRAGLFDTRLPCTASHEGSGTVVAVGSSVSNFESGDRVLCGLMYHRCRKCEICTGPDETSHYCAHVEGHNGVLINGCFAEYEVVDARECWHLPENLSFVSAAPLACAGLTVWGGIVRSGLRSGQVLAIVGAGGGLGHLGIQFAKALGLIVVAVDARDEALELAKACGANFVVDARAEKERVVEEVQKVTGGRGADATLNVSDHDSAATIAVAITRMQGLMVQIAQPENVSVPFRELVFRDVRIHGSLLCSHDQGKEMLDVVSKQQIKVQTIHFKGLEEIPKALELVASGKMKGRPVILIDAEAIAKERAESSGLI